MGDWDIALKSAFSSKGKHEMSVLKVLIYGTMTFVFSILTFLKYINKTQFKIVKYR